MKFSLSVLCLMLPLLAHSQEIKPECFSAQWSSKINFSGYIDVPEDYIFTISETNRIRIFYYGRLVQDKEPVIFFNGGPGGSSHSSSQAIFAKDESDDFSFIFMDQRGTGCSTNYIENRTEDGVKKLSLYTADNIVKDAEEVRKKLLGQKKWKIFGQSYGALIVHHYVELFPESIISAHAHGYALTSDPIAWFTERMLSSQRVYNEFKNQNPGVDKKLKKLNQIVDLSICFEKDSYRICGSSLLDPLIRFVAFTTSWPTLNQWVDAILNPDESLNKQNLQNFFDRMSFGFYRFTGFGARSIVPAIDILGGYTHAHGCKLVEEKLIVLGQDPSSWILNECRILKDSADSKWEELILKNVPIQSYGPEKMRTALEKNPELKFYLYSGQLDSFVPFTTFTEENQVLRNLISYTNFKNSGHEGYLSEPLVWENLKK